MLSFPKKSIRYVGSNALYTAYTAYTVYTVNNIFTVNIVNKVVIVSSIQTTLHCSTSSMHAYTLLGKVRTLLERADELLSKQIECMTE